MESFSFLEALSREADLDEGGVLVPSPQDKLERYLGERRERFGAGILCPVVRPTSTAQVQKIMMFASRHPLGVIPQGGNTGLVGGQVPAPHVDFPQFILSLERMKAIRTVFEDKEGIVCEAGVILSHVQQEAQRQGRLFPLDLASRESAHVGGLIATNAGGISVLRYGQMRSLVMGLEVVLPTGEIWQNLSGVKKDNTGYDLKQVFIGAEGTLGVITAACLRLFPPVETRTVGISAKTPRHLQALFTHLKTTLGEHLTAFEVVPEEGIRMGQRHGQTSFPFAAIPPWFGVVEVSFSPLFSAQMMDEVVLRAFEAPLEEGIIDDCVLAQTLAQGDNLWEIRECLSEVQRKEGGSFKHDVSVPLPLLPEFIDAVNGAVGAYMPAIRPVPFGHFGDGNLHYNFSQPLNMDKEEFHRHRSAVEQLVFEEVYKRGGSIAAEHGIGQAKRTACAVSKKGAAYDMMQRLKKTFDPHGIMNPYKVL